MEKQNNMLAKEKWWGEDKVLQQINGFWFMPHIIPRIQQILAKFKPHTNDVILVSFPKTGTTWLIKALVYSLMNPSFLNSLVNIHPQDLVPTLERGLPISDVILDTPKIFHTHIPYQLLGKTLESSGCRVVYITGNPSDTLNSMWHFVNKMKWTKENLWELEEAVEKFCRGLIPWGLYYEHTLGYRTTSLKNPSKVFFITYEELKADAKTHIKRLAEFLGCSFVGGDEKVEEIAKSCSFEVSSNHEVNKSEDCRGYLQMPNYSFFRQAKVGDHKNYLNDEAIKNINVVTREKFHKCDFIYGV